jgi:mono/diheme cytochrome c family protein
VTLRARLRSVILAAGRRARVVAACGGQCACALVCLLLAAACTQKMAHQPKYGPLAPSDFFGDRLSARPIVSGAVAREEKGDDSASMSAYKSGGAYVDTIPLPLTPQLVERGRERYEIFCAACHGRTGEGDGPVAGTQDYRFPPPLPFSAEEVRARPAGFYFEVMTKGYREMGRYSHQVSARDRWAIIAYIRELQQLHPQPSRPGSAGGR